MANVEQCLQQANDTAGFNNLSANTWPPPGINISDYDLSKCAVFATYCSFRLSINVFVVGPLCLAGLIGNTLAILVLRTDCLNPSMSFMLQALAVADNAYLVACVFMQTLKALTECSDIFPALKMTYPFMEPYIWPVASIAQTIAVWFVVLLTSDRYVAFSRPFSNLRLSTLKRTHRTVVFVIIAAILYNIPRFLELETRCMTDMCLNRMRLVSVHTKLRKNKIYFIVYKTCLYFLFRVIIPLGSIAFMNASLIMTLRAIRKDHAMLTKSQSRNHYFTKVLVAMVSVFILCTIPDFLMRAIATVTNFTGTSKSMAYYYCITLTNMLLTLNSAINCLIYCLVGPRFRKVLRHLFCRRCDNARVDRLPRIAFKASHTSSLQDTQENHHNSTGLADLLCKNTGGNGRTDKSLRGAN